MKRFIAMDHTEATLKGLNKPDLIKVGADVAIVKNVNKKLVNQLIETERQCWANAQYSMQECLEAVGIPTPISNDLLETSNSKVFDKV